jgi:membrane-bound lytic murein transglycosylase A
MRKIAGIMSIFVVALFFLAACAEKPLAPPSVTLKPVVFAGLPGWQNDRQSETLPAFARSCEILAKKEPETALDNAGKAKDWQPICAALESVGAANDSEARNFFETWFAPYAVVSNKRQDGLFTGYYEAEMNGAWRQGGVYQTPLWQTPTDLVTVNLGEFKSALKGQNIYGKVEHGRLVPYDDRAAVAQGSLKGRAQPLLWVDDPVSAFFSEIQGAGRVRLPDGSEVRVGYAAQNGRAYVPLGRVLADEGEVERPVTMAKIRTWLKAHPDRAAAMMNQNPSLVFFRLIESDGATGANGIVLTPLRSLAVDPHYIPLHAPLWLDVPEAPGGALARLVVAQDTGGAIKGPVRGDLFWGAGLEAEAQAGAMQNSGTYYLLLPKTVSP